MILHRMEYLEVHITDSCNLKCKGCSHCAGLVPDGQHISFSSFMNDLNRMKELIPDIGKLRILGGEPFLNPDMARYLKIAREIYPGTDIRIVTNGTLCLQADRKIYQCMRENNITIDVSLYPPTIGLKKKLEFFFQEENIHVHFTKPITQFVKRITLAADSDIEQTFWKCDSKWCNFLRNGILCSCPAPIILDWLSEYYKLGIKTDEGKIDIYQEGLNADDIIAFLNRPNPICRYCTDLQFFEWEGNAVPKLEDWIVDDG